MRSSLIALFATVAIVSGTETKCAQNDIEELVSRTDCGCPKSISKCLSADVDLQRLNEIEKCFVGSGCSEAEAATGAVWFAHECHEGKSTVGQDELKRRAAADSSTTDDQSLTDVKTTTKSDAKTTEKTSEKTTEKTTTTAPSSAAASTTSESSTESSAAASSTTAAPSSTTTTANPTTSSTDTTSSTPSTSSTTSTSAGTQTTPLSCYITSTVQTSACSVSAGRTISCEPTVTAVSSCAPGLLCFSPTAGANSCMKKEDKLTTSGLIVSIAFVGGILAAIVSWTIVSLRARNRRKHNEQVRQMMASSGKGRSGSDVEAVSSFGGRRHQAMASEANLPLISPGGTRSDQQSYGQQEGYFSQHALGGNSLTPPGREGPGAPKLHPGLGALGQETRY